MVLTSAKRDLALLAGRKLLLADDSVTIQKVIDLTFADEGVQVVAFGDGRAAMANIEEIAPDVVLADVFMPFMNGYEVCEYIKQNEKLKHIPVMLLVGSFEPFDEAEARRVGADDTLTKPFQSIRRLIEKVGVLVGSRPAGEETPTAELPATKETPAEPERLSTEELEVTTADTQPLAVDLRAPSPHFEQEGFGTESITDNEQMESPRMEMTEESLAEPGDVLLDLGEFEPIRAAGADDFVLELDLEEAVHSDVREPMFAGEPLSMRAFVEPQVSEAAINDSGQEFAYQPENQNEIVASYAPARIGYEDQVHEVPYGQPEVRYEVLEENPGVVVPESSTGQSSLRAATVDNVSPELIEAIARRAVELLSDKVVREIAWDVVPELAELLIKRQLEEKESQPK
jgi:CheY-like chemotaxis protein